MGRCLKLKIKPCPFCGNKEIELDGDPYENMFIECAECHIQMDIDPTNAKEEIEEFLIKLLIKRWNKRQWPINTNK